MKEEANEPNENHLVGKGNWHVALIVIFAFGIGMLLAGVGLAMWHWESFPRVIAAFYITCAAFPFFIAFYSMWLHSKGKFYIDAE